jgi:hypothetical protein
LIKKKPNRLSRLDKILQIYEENIAFSKNNTPLTARWHMHCSMPPQLIESFLTIQKNRRFSRAWKGFVMFKNLGNQLLLCTMTVMSTFVTVPAFADDYYGNPNGWTTCQTQSQGRQFRDADYGVDAGRARTLLGCTQNPYTNNGECRYNVSCEGEIPGAYARCTTRSQNRAFLDGGADLNQVRNAVMQACEQNPYTNNGECRYNVSCDGGGVYQPAPPVYQPAPPVYQPAPPVYQPAPPVYQPAPPVYQPAPPVYVPSPPVYQPAPPAYNDPNRQFVCSTESNGRSFSVPGRGFEQTRFKVIVVCQQDQFTDKNACSRNARCP